MLIPVLIGLLCIVLGGAGALAWQYARLQVRLREIESAPCIVTTGTDDKRLEALSTEYDALLAHCGGGVVLIGPNDIIERVNLKARYLLGAPTIEMVGNSVLRGTLSTDLDTLVKEVRASQRVERREISNTGPGMCQLDAVASPVMDPDRRKCRIILILRDVTELRRLETVRKDFVANVSHELRTPLTSIRAMAETLQDGALQDRAVACHFLDTIIDETVRLTRISDDLLHLSQAESRSSERLQFNLCDLCNKVAGRLAVQADKAGLRMEVELPARVDVMANHDQIEQVLVNLLDNAIKYTPAGGEVRLAVQPTQNAVGVRVTDTGIGIMTDDIPRIFERFYRVDKARSRESGGTGLGLSIVKHIVEAHGGEVRVDSEFNHGSAFTFTLPTG